MHWELWNTEANGLVATFATEDEALQAVREILAVNPPEYIGVLALGAMYDEDEARHSELPPVLEGAALRTRLSARSPQSSAVEATRSAHARIKVWLTEEKWTIEDVAGPLATLNMIVGLPGGDRVNVYQRAEHRDHLTVGVHTVLVGSDSSGSSYLTEETRRDLVWDIDRDVSIMGLDFEALDTSPVEMRYGSVLYFDALTKDALIQKILLVRRALNLSRRLIARRYEQAGGSAAATKDLLRVVPSAAT